MKDGCLLYISYIFSRKIEGLQAGSSVLSWSDFRYQARLTGHSQPKVPAVTNA